MNYLKQKITREPLFIFPEIKSSGDFMFEKLTQENFQQLYLMFESDDNEFTDNRFKHYESARMYAANLEKYGAFSAKHGGQDWFFLWKNNYAGILHLYDLSLENFADNDKRCWIGFATKSALRNKGITRKAVQLFIQYIFKNYSSIKFIHAMTDKNNKTSQLFLSSLSFKKDLEERFSKEHIFYVYEKPILNPSQREVL